MIGSFDREEYWKQRNAPADQQKILRRMRKQERFPVVGVHDKPDWPEKPVSKKAWRKHGKRRRKLEAAR